MPDPARPPVRASVACVIVENGRILAGVRRGPPEKGGGQTAMPGGSIEPGESIEQAAEREALEETGLVVKALPYSSVQAPLFVVNHVGGDGHHFVCLFVECRVVGGSLDNREPDLCDGWAYLTFDQLAARVPPEAVAAWRDGGTHPVLNWIPLPQLAYFRDALGLQ